MDHHSSGTGGWQNRAEASLAPLRTPKALGLSANAPEFVPKKIVSPPQQQQSHQSQYGSGAPVQRYRGDNNGTAGGGGGGGGGGTYNMLPVSAHYPPVDTGNGVIVNGTDIGIGKSSGLTERLRNLQMNNSGPQQQPQLGGGHSSYSDNKDNRNSSHYNHHQHQQHPNQHYPQHSQQQRLQQHHMHQQQQQQPQQPHLPMHQNVAGPTYPFVGYSSTALNNHLHHPMLGGMAAAAAHQPMQQQQQQHDNRNKNNSFLRSRLQNAQNSHMQPHHHNHQQQQQHHHQQHHQQHHHSHQQHHHQQPQHHGMHGGSNDFGADGDSDQLSENETYALDYLTDVVQELYGNPGLFDNIQRKLKGIFAEFRSNQYVLSNAVELLFEQSIKEQNFRYMGARLCKLLDTLDENPKSVLRQLLNMKMTHQHSELQGFMTNEQIKVRGTTLFLAELYMQLRKPNDFQRNVEIAMRITAAAKVLLNKEGPENIKCVCQCLKLCGFELERDCRDQLLEILETLGQLENSTDNSTGRFIRSVLDLQQKSWGRNEEVVPVMQPPMNELSSSVADEFTDSPVFYGPDGQIMTEEENDFLETATPATFEEYDDEEGDPDELVDDDNMDPEIKQAFKEFVTGTNSRQPY